MGNIVIKDLVPGGRDLAVTNSNRAQCIYTASNKRITRWVRLYIYLMADHYLNRSIEGQCRAFVSGFQEIIPYDWTRIFSPKELQQIISGNSSQIIDVGGIFGITFFPFLLRQYAKDMERHTKYHGYTALSSTIRNFWRVVREMSPEEQKKLVKFITGYLTLQ